MGRKNPEGSRGPLFNLAEFKAQQQAKRDTAFHESRKSMVADPAAQKATAARVARGGRAARNAVSIPDPAREAKVRAEVAAKREGGRQLERERLGGGGGQSRDDQGRWD